MSQNKMLTNSNNLHTLTCAEYFFFFFCKLFSAPNDWVCYLFSKSYVFDSFHVARIFIVCVILLKSTADVILSALIKISKLMN